jgi:hypothetical protein
MGKNGALKTHLRTAGNVTTNKTYKLYLGSAVAAFFGAMSTNPNAELISSTKNQGSESLQINSPQASNTGVGLVTNGFQSGAYSAADTAIDQTLSISLQISTTAACAVLLHADITCTYGA